MLPKPKIAEVCPPLCRSRRLDCSERDPDAAAEMSDVSGRIRCGMDWGRAFVLNGDTVASVARDSMRWIDYISGDEKRASLNSQI